MNRRYILFGLIGFVILVIIGLVLFAVDRQNASKNNAATALQLKVISTDTAIGPINGLQNDSVWYFSQNALFRVGLDGNNRSEFPMAPFAGTIQSVNWPAKSADLLATGTSSSTKTGPIRIIGYYNSQSKFYRYFPSNVQSIDWMPDDQRVVYVWKPNGTGNPSLVMSNADGTGFKTIANVFWPDLQVQVSPSGKTALLFRGNIGGSVNKIYSADLASGQISSVVDNGNNSAAKWLPDGQRFIYTQIESVDKYPELFLYDETSQNSKDLGVATTLEKVAIESDGQTLDIAVPQNGGGDKFVKLNIQAAKQTDYFTPPTTVRATQIFLVDHTIYFVNLVDGNLESIQ